MRRTPLTTTPRRQPEQERGLGNGRVRPSVCPIDRQQQRRAAGLLLSARRAGGIDRLLSGTGCPVAAAPQQRESAAANAGSATHFDS